MRFLFVDRIVELSSGESVKGIKHITQDDAYLTLDDQGKLCFMPSLIGETLGQLLAWNVMQFHHFSLRPVAGVVSQACLYRPAYVGETLLLESYIDALDDQVVQYHSKAYIGNDLVFSIESALGPLLPMKEFISDELIKAQFNEINRPGDWERVVASSLTPVSSPSTEEEKMINPSSDMGTVKMVMMFDSISLSDPGLSLVAVKRITRAAPYFEDHFPNKPVLPLTVLLECKQNLAREFVKRAGFTQNFQIRELNKIKMSEFVLPGDVLICYVKLKEHSEEQLVLSCRSEVDGKRVCVVDVVLVPKGK